MKINETDKEMQARHDLETLIDAEKIKLDKDRLAAAMKEKRKQQKALENVDGKKGS